MIEVVKNELSDDGMKTVRFVSDAPLSLGTETSPHLTAQNGRSVRTWTDEALGLHYLEMTYPLREVVTMKCEPKDRKFVVWKLMPGERVSEIIEYIADWYFCSAHRRPQYAFMRKLPKGVENGATVGDVVLLRAEWAMAGCVMVGG